MFFPYRITSADLPTPPAAQQIDRTSHNANHELKDSPPSTTALYLCTPPMAVMLDTRDLPGLTISAFKKEFEFESAFAFEWDAGPADDGEGTESGWSWTKLLRMESRVLSVSPRRSSGGVCEDE